ncbi:radiation-inducible immediate-early gene IEX-1-like [Scyliorhinus canicula]|uniref:radiation-inducible immediate-early gene IEX-1-like n=1 Tax=Scyliorhinus canicula TaxID=7830 RepID=UPI0018F4777E|nr:radiation-inducible immediate-early gene IEX-1-like [Scyliorhinus canicula]
MCLATPCPVRLNGKFPGSSSQTKPLVFTFEPIPERLCNVRIQKKRPCRIIYPPPQARKSVPNKKDMAKRLFLFFLSIVIFQVHTTVEDGMNLPTPDLSVAEPASVPALPPSSPDVGALPDMYLPALPAVGPNYNKQQPAGGHWLQAARVLPFCMIRTVVRKISCDSYGDI